jgi:hypothetical protein
LLLRSILGVYDYAPTIDSCRCLCAFFVPLHVS